MHHIGYWGIPGSFDPLPMKEPDKRDVTSDLNVETILRALKQSVSQSAKWQRFRAHVAELEGSGD